MTNIFISQKIDEDFFKFPNALKKTAKFKYSISTINLPYLKRYHRLTYIIALINQKAKGKWNEGNKFLFQQEIVSDLLANLSLTFLGFYQSSQILIRRVVENFYNHIFYFDHSIEYQQLNLGRNEYLPMIDLKSYLDSHPKIREYKDNTIKTYNEDIFKHYQELNRFVHTKGINFMGGSLTLEDIKIDFDVNKQLNIINKTLLKIIYILFKFHNELNYSHVEIDLVSKSFPKSIRSGLLG